jgi:hypothetical protein
VFYVGQGIFLALLYIKNKIIKQEEKQAYGKKKRERSKRSK